MRVLVLVWFMGDQIQTSETSWISTQNKRQEALKAGETTPEKYHLQNLGYEVTDYVGKIPLETFTCLVDPLHKDKDTTGSRNQIYIEPGEKVCYKTRIANGEVFPMEKSHTGDSLSFPGYINEGIFLSKVAKYNLAGVPKFIGFVELPDKRMSVAQEYIPDTIAIPSRYSGRMDNMTPETIYSIFEALGPVAETVDTILRLGGGINTTEITDNMRMTMDGDKVKAIWIVDFEGYADPTLAVPDNRDTLDGRTSGISTTLYTLLLEAISSRQENKEKPLDHVAIDYMNFVVYGGDNKGDWTKPKSSKELVDSLIGVLKEHPLEEVRKPTTTTDSEILTPPTLDEKGDFTPPID